jgi:transcriptional regulator NrdR family protein
MLCPDCPECGKPLTYCLSNKEGEEVRRKYCCETCKLIVDTYEMIELTIRYGDDNE